MSMKEKMLQQMSALGTPALKSIQELEKKVDKVYEKMNELIRAIGHHDDWIKWHHGGRVGSEPVWEQIEQPQEEENHEEQQEQKDITPTRDSSTPIDDPKRD